MQLEIRNFLTLSTGHLPEQFAQQLDNTDHTTWPVCGGPFDSYGWFMYASEDDQEGRIPPELMEIFKIARANNCPYVLFDCDGPQVDGLPFFNW